MPPKSLGGSCRPLPALPRSQLPQQPVTISDVHLLQVFEGGEKFSGVSGITAALLEIAHDLTLSSNVQISERDMLLGLLQVILEHCAVHHSEPSAKARAIRAILRERHGQVGLGMNHG
jgi:hypothetical protein